MPKSKKSRRAGRPARREWRAHPHLYQINTWAWLEELSQRAGRKLKLADVPDAEWDAIAELGFDFVYLLGVWQRSTAGRRFFRTDPGSFSVFDQALPEWRVRSVVGSPFSISDYVPDKRLGGWKQLDAVRAKLHARGMGLILDFVPNHTGPDHPWVLEHPDFYLRGSEEDFHRSPSSFHLIEPKKGAPYFVARGRDPFFLPWADTAQLDYYSPLARAALIEVLREIAGHCDGLRCDMAMLVLNEVFGRTWSGLLRERPAPEREFWVDALAAVREDFVWLAEVYWEREAELQGLGFDYTYDKVLYDRLGEGTPAQVRDYLRTDPGYQSRMARFLENHDEPRAATLFGSARLPGLVALLATLPGLRFFQHGQLEGKTIHLPMPLCAAEHEEPDAELAAMYSRLLRVADEATFHDGEWALLEAHADNDDSHQSLLTYRWRSAGGYRLVVLNLSNQPAHGRVRLAEELPEAPRYAFADALADTIYLREREDLANNGLYVRLDPYAAHVFAVDPSDQPLATGHHS